jgi:hypothetical protein
MEHFIFLRQFFLSRLLAAALVLSGSLSGWSGDTGKLPGLAVIKAAAETGDAEAQLKLGRSYHGTFDYQTAVKWFRLAAEQGLAEAQTEMGAALLNGRPPITRGKTGVKADLPQAIKWFHLAANQGESGAMSQLGQCFQTGNGVPANRVAAYRWLKLASDRGRVVAKVYLDRLILEMSAAEIAQGQTMAERFVPRKAAPSPVPPSGPTAGGLVLKGISGNATNRLAILNDKTFAVGETRTIHINGTNVSVLCLEIREASVSVRLEGRSDPEEVSFRPR